MLRFIGTGSAFNYEQGNNSAYIKENGVLLLFDCGSTVFSGIQKLNLLEDVNDVFIAITHFHADHVGSLATLIAYLNNMGITPNFVLSNGDDSEIQEKNLRNYLSMQGIEEEDFEVSFGDMLEDVLTNLVKVEMVKLKHSSKLTSYAVELYFNERTVYYTGDHNDVNYLTNVTSKLNKTDLVYTDCSLRNSEESAHISLEKLAEIFNEDIRSQICCMHFDNYNVYSEAKELGFKVANKEITKEELLRRINRK